MPIEWLCKQDVSDIEHWSQVAKAYKLKDKIELLDLLSLIIAPVSKKHGRLVDRERAQLVKRYDGLLGIGEVRQTAEIAENTERLREVFREWG